MKKSILTLVALGVAVSAMGQGWVNYSTRVIGSVVAPVYGPGVGETSQLSGNTLTGTPVGAQIYTGLPLAGSGFSAQLFAAPGAGQLESALVAVPGSLTSFRTGTTAGNIAASVLQIPNVNLHTTGTFQLRAWDNAGGTIGSWDLADTKGKSALFEIANLGDGILDFPTDMTVRSFNIYAVPEPSMFLLAGLGAASLLIFRRRK